MQNRPLLLTSIIFTACLCCSAEFIHPGILVTRPMLEQIKENIRQKREPQWSAFKRIMTPTSGSVPPIDSTGAVWLANLSYVPHPKKLWIVNKSLSPGTRWLSCKEDSLAAYTHALLSFITDDSRHAAKSASIMNAWSAVLTKPVWSADALEAAWSGTIWARAAEIIKHTAPAGTWPDAKILAFEKMLTDIFLPLINEGASTNGNIALVMSEAALGIGVLTDNATVVDAQVSLWRQQAPAYVYVSTDGPTPKRPPLQRYLARTAPVCGPNCTDAQIVTYWHGNSQFSGHDGIAQETCRDLGHTEMLLAALANFAETAFHQGINLYGENRDRIVAAAEFHASLMSDEPVALRQRWPSWLCNGRCTGEYCAPANGSTFEIVHHHYVRRLNMSLPNVTALLPQIR